MHRLHAFPCLQRQYANRPWWLRVAAQASAAITTLEADGKGRRLEEGRSQRELPEPLTDALHQQVGDS